MLYAHYEVINMLRVMNMLSSVRSQDDPTQNLVRFVASNSFTAVKTSFSKADYARLQSIIEVIKLIPSSQRSYDPSTKVWTLREDKFRSLMVFWDRIQQVANLDSFLNFSLYSAATTARAARADAWKTFQAGTLEVENPEDFFKAPPSAPSAVLSSEELRLKLSQLIKPYINFSLSSREDFLRGYKIAARRLHPDVAGGSAAAMSELNSLFAQYKESLSIEA